MARFGTWESYFYPPPDQATLRNVPGIRDRHELQAFEYAAAALREQQLYLDPSLVRHSFDGAHLQGIHRYLFQDVYEWAGRYRSVNMAKGPGRDFGDVTTGELERYLQDVHRLVTQTPWPELDRAGFVDRAAIVFAYLNQAHPFREGNGRTSKVFMQQVAAQSQRFGFDYARVTPAVWNQASGLSRPDLEAYPPQPASLVPVFAAITVERAASGPATVERGREASRASYPQSPTRATGQPASRGRRSRPPGPGSGSGRGPSGVGR